MPRAPKIKAKRTRVEKHSVVDRLRGPIVVATDGASDIARLGMGYLSTSGHYGICGHPYSSDASQQQRVVVAELRAVYLALHQIAGSERGPIEVKADSREALGYLKEWSQGGTKLPPGYSIARISGATSTLENLRQLVFYVPQLTFTWVRGHDGHPLNEAADSLAKLALRTSRGLVEAKIAGDLAERWAKTNLNAYAASVHRSSTPGPG